MRFRSCTISVGHAENYWVQDLCPAYWKQISKSLDHIKKSKVEENQSHHAYDRDDKRKIKSEWFSQFQWLQHKDSMFFCQVCIDGKKTNKCLKIYWYWFDQKILSPALSQKKINWPLMPIEKKLPTKYLHFLDSSLQAQ